MRIVIFAHSLVSCWNHGNAHFLRGVARALGGRGHEVRVFEPASGWSRANMLADAGPAAIERFETDYPGLTSETYGADPDVEALLDGADLVLVHEWTEPSVVAAIGQVRARGGRFALLFHDTHHRAASDPDAIRAFDLDAYDGVLAFGASLAERYRAWGWGARVHVWHEAADTARFAPPAEEGHREGLVWIGNWGDGERNRALQEYLLGPAKDLGLPLDIHGVRYPEEALSALRAAGATYRGWLANADAPGVFARHIATIHVPRGFYVTHLPGIPTIRVFEALACGIPLLSAPWDDTENLFRVGDDFLMARDPADMTRRLRDLAHDPVLRATLAANGLWTIQARHTCAHRADELLAIAASLQQPARVPAETV